MDRFLMKNLPIINQTKHPTKVGGKSYKMERTPSPGKWTTLQWGWMVRGWKRYKMEGAKSWQMKNPPMGVDGVGVEKVQDWRSQVLANEESSKEGGSPGEQEQIKYPNLPACLPSSVVKSISDNEMGGGTPFFHFHRQVKDPEWFRLGQICTFVAKFP